MDTNKFLAAAQFMVANYSNNRSSVVEDVVLGPQDVYVVWYCKTLQNSKALLSTPIPDGMYYEVTYNGDKSEYYFDAYQKVENMRISEGSVY